MLLPLWLDTIVVAAQQWLPAALLGGFALFLGGARRDRRADAFGRVWLNGHFHRPVTRVVSPRSWDGGLRARTQAASEPALLFELSATWAAVRAHAGAGFRHAGSSKPPRRSQRPSRAR